jgi:hypothetical protein
LSSGCESRPARRRLGQLLREEISDTVEEPAEVDAELKHLLAVLGEC